MLDQTLEKLLFCTISCEDVLHWFAQDREPLLALLFQLKLAKKSFFGKLHDSRSLFSRCLPSISYGWVKISQSVSIHSMLLANGTWFVGSHVVFNWDYLLWVKLEVGEECLLTPLASIIHRKVTPSTRWESMCLWEVARAEILSYVPVSESEHVSLFHPSKIGHVLLVWCWLCCLRRLFGLPCVLPVFFCIQSLRLRYQSNIIYLHDCTVVITSAASSKKKKWESVPLSQPCGPYYSTKLWNVVSLSTVWLIVRQCPIRTGMTSIGCFFNCRMMQSWRTVSAHGAAKTKNRVRRRLE